MFLQGCLNLIHLRLGNQRILVAKEAVEGAANVAGAAEGGGSATRGTVDDTRTVEGSRGLDLGQRGRELGHVPPKAKANTANAIGAHIVFGEQEINRSLNIAEQFLSTGSHFVLAA